MTALFLCVFVAGLIVASPAFADREYVCQITGAGGASTSASECDKSGAGVSGGRFASPAGVAVDGSGDLWVSDDEVGKGTAMIDEFSASGELLHQHNGESTCKNKAGKEEKDKLWSGNLVRGIAFNEATNDLYVADSIEAQLWVFGPEDCVLSEGKGEIVGPWLGFAHGNGGTFIQMTVDNSQTAARGDVYVSSGNSSFGQVRGVYRIEPKGNAEGHAVPAPFSCPEAEVGPEPYIATSYEFQGKKESVAEITGAPTGPGGSVVRFGEPAAMTVAPLTGDLFVAGDEFASSGCFIRQVPGGGLMAVDPVANHLLTVDSVEVAEVSLATGALLPEPIVEAPGESFGGIGGVAVSSAGDVYVSDGLHKAVDEFGPYKPPPKYALKVEETGSGSGEVTGVPGDIDCPSTCSASFTKGEAVTLTEKAEAGSRFVRWSGCKTEPVPDECVVEISEPKTVAAIFEQESHPVLTVEEPGSGSGEVRSVQSGISCPSACSASFAKDETVTLTEKEDAGSRFVRWTGCKTEPASDECVIEVSEAMTVSAIFEPKLVALEVLEPGFGSGTVTSTPVGIDCPGMLACVGEFHEDGIVVLIARPALGSVFAGWSGGGCLVEREPSSRVYECEVSMSAARSVEAMFAPVLDELAVTVTGNGVVGSHVGAASGAISGCTESGGVCAGEFQEGSEVTLTEKPGVHQRFAGWSGACSGTKACTVSISEARLVSAVFEPVLEPVEVLVAGSGSGTVKSTPAGIDCGSTCTAGFEEGVSLTLTAIPGDGSVFAGWSGGGCSGVGVCEVTPTIAVSVTATFTTEPLPVQKPVVLVSTTLTPVLAMTTTVPVVSGVKPGSKPKAKPLTNAQKLARALKACRAEHIGKRKRTGCEARARKRYAAKAKTKARKGSGRGSR